MIGNRYRNTYFMLLDIVYIFSIKALTKMLVWFVTVIETTMIEKKN